MCVCNAEGNNNATFARCYNIVSLVTEVAKAAPCCSIVAQRHSTNYIYKIDLYIDCFVKRETAAVVQHQRRREVVFKRTALSLCLSPSMLLCRYFVLSERLSTLYFGMLLLLIFPPTGESGGEDNHFNRVGLYKKKGGKRNVFIEICMKTPRDAIRG